MFLENERGVCDMRCRVNGRNYVILPDGEKFPVKFNKKKMDAVLERLEKALSSVSELMGELYDNDYDAFNLIASDVFYDACFKVNDGHIVEIEDALYSLNQFKDKLQSSDDDIPDYSDLVTLDDLGYVIDDPRVVLWRKELSSSAERDVCEEIFQDENGSYVRRERTIDWETTEYGRSSKSIVYRKLSIGKKLMKVIENSFEGRS